MAAQSTEGLCLLRQISSSGGYAYVVLTSQPAANFTGWFRGRLSGLLGKNGRLS